MEAATRAMDAGSDALPATVRVWDPFVRIFHWSLVALFAFAFLTGDEWDKPHEFAGYVVAGLIGLRVIWGFIGTRHARFSDFVTGPGTVIGYLKDAAGFRARRHLGHNPAGGAMVLALLAAIAVISLTGHMMTTDAYWGVKWVEEVHEAAAFGTLGLIALHVGGVVFASIEHGENLVRAMVTGRKRAS
ncbi:MAG: cytochrome b/b6 domain-containing protein [Rhodobiaceae bacterium]|nr:cytochrome b/b6 domain-containing protein [Rhodobiaceae bacterium]MCC0017393.1 cytochrome b/b6 domain-containing protein [Rhodobiaceae bacterium]MCC0041136.1 cytochrome b/b6 domain-containing protein [Rhodobiaceae bacterium]